jgi:urea transport system substrate-binding protein
MPDPARWLYALTLAAGLAWLLVAVNGEDAAPPIRIGVLHSLTGTMAVSEAPLLDAARLAVEEINAAGGLLGRRVEIVVADGRSDPDHAAAEAERLIRDDDVAALFACWTSACRKAVKPVVERHRHLMFYPVQYEGMEQSEHILYTGSAPNQQIVPGARWALERFGKRVFLIGSDYIFPRAANLIARDLIEASGGVVVGERYLPLGSPEVDDVVAELGRARPDVVLNTLNGDSNAALFRALARAGLADLPLVSFSVAETEAKAWGGGELRRHFGVWSYFQSLQNPENRRFVAAFQARFGPDRVTSDPIEASYVGVHLWARAATIAGSVEPRRVNRAALGLSLPGPSAIVSIDPGTRHVWKMVRVGQFRPDGQFAEILASRAPARPAPWPFHRSRQEWRALTRDLATGGRP